MAAQIYNNTFDTLATDIDSVVTSFDVSSGDIPAVAAGDYIPIHVIRASDKALEIMHVTDVSGTTLTVDRAAEPPGDSPITFKSGDRVEIRPTRQSLAETDVSGNEVTSSSGTQLVHAALDDRARLSGGADADFTLMPRVGGDPIVESDSNAAGEYTRWADGTQISVSNTFSGAADAAGGGTHSSPYATAVFDWTYPAAFNGTPVVTDHSWVSANASDIVRANVALASAISTGDFRIVSLSAGTAGDTANCRLVANGRWKA